jgi:hypothetical protein
LCVISLHVCLQTTESLELRIIDKFGHLLRRWSFSEKPHIRQQARQILANLRPKQFLRDLMNAMERLRNNESIADKRLEYFGHTFFVHSNIICFRCPLLFTKFDTLKAHKISPQTVLCLLQYVYTGVVKSQKIDPNQLCELLFCASELSLVNLELLCCHYLLGVDEPEYILQVASSSYVKKTRRAYRTVAQKISELNLMNKITDKQLLEKALKRQRKQLPAPDNTLVQDMRRLYAASITNVTLRIRGVDVKADKTILSAWCPFFESMFRSKMQESYKTIIEHKSDLKPETFQALLAYFYTGELQCAPPEIIEIHAALDFYGLQDCKHLVALCENVYYDDISLKDVSELFQKAIKFNIYELKERIQSQFDNTLYHYAT